MEISADVEKEKNRGDVPIDYGCKEPRCACTTWYVRDIPDTNFYKELEEGVRGLVYVLRQHGINTECSCHHEGYIQISGCGGGDRHTLRKIWLAMYEANCLPYSVHFTREVGKTGHVHETCNIKSPLLKVEKSK